MSPITIIALSAAGVVAGLLVYPWVRKDIHDSVKFDPRDPHFIAMVRRIERRDSGGQGRID